MSIGNDIVCLETSSVRYNSQRFLKRVFTQSEQQQIKISQTPHRTLWTLWAVKEAVFKAHQQQCPTAYFSPVMVEVVSAESAIIDESVYYYKVMQKANWVHAVASDVLDDLENVKLKIERMIDTSVSYKEQSLATKAIALKLIAQQGLLGDSLVRPPISSKKLGPPKLLHNGIIQPHEVSLSHDGQLNAVALVKR